MATQTQTTTPETRKAPECPIQSILDFMDKYIVFPDQAQADVCALWVLHTWAFDAAYCTPYIYITSAEKQSGKTRVIEVLEMLSRNPIRSAGSTASTLFRDVEANQPTVFYDEVDAVFTGAANEELRGMLNTGYKQGGQTRRVVPGKDGGEVRSFSTFCPKLLAGIDNGAMPDTIADRSIRIVLKRKKAGQDVERFIARKVAPEAEAVRAQIEAWVNANMEALLHAEPKPINEISDRAWEISEPLIAIAERCRGWRDRARTAVVALLSNTESKLSPGARALTLAREWMTDNREDRIFSDTLAKLMETTPKRLSAILAPYGITPSTIRLGGNRGKGYHWSDFTEAWELYL